MCCVSVPGPESGSTTVDPGPGLPGASQPGPADRRYARTTTPHPGPTIKRLDPKHARARQVDFSPVEKETGGNRTVGLRGMGADGVGTVCCTRGGRRTSWVYGLGMRPRPGIALPSDWLPPPRPRS